MIKEGAIEQFKGPFIEILKKNIIPVEDTYRLYDLEEYGINVYRDVEEWWSTRPELIVDPLISEIEPGRALVEPIVLDLDKVQGLMIKIKGSEPYMDTVDKLLDDFHLG
jgi:hypothetical protein